jgi:L-lactate utilization protein LutC
MQKTETREKLDPNPIFARLASYDQILRTAEALNRNNIKTLIAENGEEAEQMVFDQLPQGAEVFTASSQTLEQLGIPTALERSGRYQLVRKQLAKMTDPAQNRQKIKMGATPEFVLGSVHAVTEDGQVLVASNTGSQLAPYAAAAAHVIWVVGAQKLVHNVDEGMRRIWEYAYPLEDARLMKAIGKPSAVNKILLVNREAQPGRVTMVIVKEVLGF